MKTLTDLFQTFPARGDATACIHRTGVRRLLFSYAKIHDLSLRMAAWLGSQGIGAGDRVVLWGPNSPWWMVAFWGVLARGGIVVPVDFMSNAERATMIAELTRAKLILQSNDKLERVHRLPAQLMEELAFLLEKIEPQSSVFNASPDETVEIVYTSGTTGNPKGVVLSHRNLVANILQVNQHIPVVSSDFRFLSLLPLSHLFEQMGGFLTPLYNGAAIVYIRTLKPSAILEALREEDIYAIIAVPRLLLLLKGSIERKLAAKGLDRTFSRFLTRMDKVPKGLRKELFLPIHRQFGRHFTLFVSGGAALDPEVFLFWDRLGFTLLEGYGLTECSPVLTANPLDRQKLGSVGTPLPGVTVRIVGGEILVRGENVFAGYFQNPAATDEVLQNGWFRTGDLGEFDGSGWLRIKGRCKELIVTGAGINVYPDEIEALLNRTAGVRESCVVGLDRGAGEEVHAVIVPDGGGRPLDEIIDEVNRQLDDLHRITGGSVWTEAEFPKTTTLKIRKFQVKQRLQEGANVSAGGAVDRLVLLIGKITGMPAERITDDALMVADLGLTSIGRLELVNALEQEFRLDLEDSIIGPQSRVRDLREIITRRENILLREHFRLWTTSAPAMALRRFGDALLHYPLASAFALLESQGREHLDGIAGPVLFVSNHLSYFDHPAIMFSLPEHWRYATATAAWEEFFFRNFKNSAQKVWKRCAFEYASLAFTVFPLPQTRGFRGALRHMGRLADRGKSILVFPEGERSVDGTLLPFRLGLGIMVRELAIPVVPVRISGLEKVFPRGAAWPHRGAVRVAFGEPLYFTTESPTEIVAVTRKAVESL